MEESDKIHCPKCNSTQISVHKKGFSGGKAVAGVLLTGGIGLLAGTIGSNNLIITCLNCGKTFAPGEGGYKSKPTEPDWKPLTEPEYSPSAKKGMKILLKILGVLIIIISLFLLADKMYFLGGFFILAGGFILLTGSVNKKIN